MEFLTNIDQYKALKDAARQRCDSLSSNCFLTSGGIASIMQRQGMGYREFPQGLVLYADEGSYYRVFYYLDPNADLPDMTADKKAVIEEPDSAGRREKYLKSFFQKLENGGWQRIARNIQVYSELADRAEQIRADHTAAIARLSEQGIVLEDCPERHVERVIELWKGYLHETDLPVEHIGFLNDPTQRVVCALDGSDYVCGVSWWRMAGGNCEIRHTVTDPQFYKRGIGYALQTAAMVDALDGGCRGVFTYIDDRNYRSINMFRKAGIVENGRTTTQYSLEKGE